MRKRKNITLAILPCAAAISSLAMSIYALVLTAKGIVERRNASIAQNDLKPEIVEVLPLVHEESSVSSDVPVIRMEVVVTVIEEEKPAEPQQIALDAGGRRRTRGIYHGREERSGTYGNRHLQGSRWR